MKLGLATACAIAVTCSCALRLGSRNGGVPSACSRAGDEKKLSVGAGAGSFAFAWDVDHYVLVYADPSTGDGDIYVARLDAGGDAMGLPVVVEATAARSDLPNLLRAHDGWVVAWQEGTAGKAVYAHALDAGARPIGRGATIATTQSEQARPVLARAPGGRAAVAWMDSILGKGGVQVALVDPSSLAVTTPAQRVAQDDQDGWPWIAGDDGALGIVWSDKSALHYDVRFAPLDESTLAAPSGESLRGGAPHDGVLPRMIRTNLGYLAAWEDMRDDDNEIQMALVDVRGNRLGGGLVEEPGSGDANWPNMAWAGTTGGIVYYQWRDTRPQIFISFVDVTAERVRGLGDLQVSGGRSGWAKYPDVAWTGREFGVVWVDNRDGEPALWFARVACKE